MIRKAWYGASMADAEPCTDFPGVYSQKLTLTKGTEGSSVEFDMTGTICFRYEPAMTLDDLSPNQLNIPTACSIPQTVGNLPNTITLWF